MATGEVWPASVPSSTRAVAPPRWTVEGTWWVKSRGRCRAWSGSATQSWTPCRLVVPRVETSECATPYPPVIRFSSPGPDHRVHAAAVAVLDLAGEQPADGLQAGVRVRGHVHAAGVSDVVGAVVVGEAPGADQGPGSLGSVRRTVIARGPPSGTSRLVTTWTLLTGLRWHSSTSPVCGRRRSADCVEYRRSTGAAAVLLTGASLSLPHSNVSTEGANRSGPKTTGALRS